MKIPWYLILQLQFRGNSLSIPREMSEVIGKFTPVRREKFRWDAGQNAFCCFSGECKQICGNKQDADEA